MALIIESENSNSVFNAFGSGGTTALGPVSIYVKVEEIAGTKHKILCAVSLTDASSGYRSSTFAEFPPDMDGANFIRQAYEHLKTLPEFADAEDC